MLFVYPLENEVRNDTTAYGHKNVVKKEDDRHAAEDLDLHLETHYLRRTLLSRDIVSRFLRFQK